MAINNSGINAGFTIDTDNIGDTGELFSILVKIMERLRSDDGCMWDREQTHESIKKNLIEEAYEVLESIEEENPQNLKEELGDILLQVVFHSRIATDNKDFDINGVIRTIIKKLVRRHPHVFGDKSVESSQEVLSNWETIKKTERKAKNTEDLSLFSNIPKILPALHYAYEIQNRAARMGFDWESIEGVIEKVNEEMSELFQVLNLNKQSNSNAVILPGKNANNFEEKIPGDNCTRDEACKDPELSEELGDLLFSIVNLSRHLGIDSEQCLRNACRKFIERFNYMEKYSEENCINFSSLPLSEKEKLWEMAKNH